MDKWIVELEQLTNQMIARLEIADFEELESFVVKREEIIDNMKQQGLSELERQNYGRRVSNLLLTDQLILSTMNNLKDEARQHLLKVQRGRTQKSAYEAEYVTTDSMFFDYKK
ncbi:flagellar protein FliT [Paenibacillus solanacearum]|nr:flagellar protein FliT [Paenibacillus solanacearum]